jgi:hypothetical protein
VFKGAVADKYLKEQGLTRKVGRRKLNSVETHSLKKRLVSTLAPIKRKPEE